LEKWIKSISGIIPHTNKTVDIDLDGSNLIVTGANGSGKTSFLRSVFEKTIPRLVEPENSFFTINNNDISIEFNNDVPDFSGNVLCQKIVMQYYEDFRNIDIKIPDDSAITNTIEKQIYDNVKLNRKISGDLEICLLRLKIKRSLSLTEDKNTTVANEIDNWFDDFEQNIKILFEDITTKLVFDAKKRRFYINQEDKPEYKLQEMSAGYKALFDVYGDLLMRADYFNIKPSDLTGIVFID
jgi:hypothetical protein